MENQLFWMSFTSFIIVIIIIVAFLWEKEEKEKEEKRKKLRIIKKINDNSGTWTKEVVYGDLYPLLTGEFNFIEPIENQEYFWNNIEPSDNPIPRIENQYSLAKNDEAPKITDVLYVPIDFFNEYVDRL